jgi:predicted transposase YbfD/YdcC
MEFTTFVRELQLPESGQAVEATSLYQRLAGVHDGRAKRGRRYRAEVVVTLILLAKLAGEKSLRGITEWARLRQAWLAEHVPLWHGQAPCANTYRSICDHLNLYELNTVMSHHFGAVPTVEATVAPTAADTSLAAKPLTHLALDGKSLRGTRRTANTAAATTHVVGFYNVTADAMWQQQTVAGKGQERAAAFTLLKPLNLHGCVVSADALHTQPKWGQAILDRGGDYLLLAKRNQSELRDAVALLFSQAPQPYLWPEQQAHSVDKQHGRLEVRHLRVSRELADYLTPRWPKVTQVFQVERLITRNGKTTQELAYGLTSLAPHSAPPADLLALIRAHWQIENRNHWRRDVTLGEDACRVTTGQVPQVLAALNNTVLALVDHLKLPNLAAALRQFAAFPAKALDLLLHTL